MSNQAQQPQHSPLYIGNVNGPHFVNATEHERVKAHAEKLAERLQAMCDCPDYRGISTHEARKAKQALAEYQNAKGGEAK